MIIDKNFNVEGNENIKDEDAPEEEGKNIMFTSVPSNLLEIGADLSQNQSQNLGENGEDQTKIVGA